MSNRRGPNDQAAMDALTGRHAGESGLIILGGPSGKSWQYLRDKIKPDVLIGVNGTIGVIGNDLDYWLLMESWPRHGGLPFDLQRARPKVRIVSSGVYHHLDDRSNVIVSRRKPLKHYDDQWNPREHNRGLLKGPLMQHKEHVKFDHSIGTVACQALHLAAILGLSSINTIGLDLCIKGNNHHWYPNMRLLKENRFWYPSIWTDYCGLQTNWLWVESAQFLRGFVHVQLQRHGLDWRDHSQGLLQALGM